MAAAQAMAPFVESIVIFRATPTRMMLCKRTAAQARPMVLRRPADPRVDVGSQEEGPPSLISMEDMTGGRPSS